MILAIDPGNIESAYVVMDDDLKPIEFGKVENWILLGYMYGDRFTALKVDKSAIEMVACYGMPVGKEVFETCVWIGRFYEVLNMELDMEPTFIYRKDEKINLCGSMKAKDGNIIQALKDRFGDKGTKKNPGWFYGFSADVWQAYAVGVTYYDMKLKEVS